MFCKKHEENKVLLIELLISHPVFQCCDNCCKHAKSHTHLSFFHKSFFIYYYKKTIKNWYNNLTLFQATIEVTSENLTSHHIILCILYDETKTFLIMRVITQPALRSFDESTSKSHIVPKAFHKSLFTNYYNAIKN